MRDLILMTGFLVYFLVKKTGQTHKFTSFWRGPFEVIEIYIYINDFYYLKGSPPKGS